MYDCNTVPLSFCLSKNILVASVFLAIENCEQNHVKHLLGFVVVVVFMDTSPSQLGRYLRTQFLISW